MGETRTLITDTLSNRCSGGPCEPKDLRNISINYTSRRHDDPLASFSTLGPIKLAAAIQLASRTTAEATLKFEIFA